MKVSRIEDTEKGWFIGDFPKAAFQSKEFEVSWRIHPAGQKWDLHYQENAVEINLLISGEMVLNNTKLVSGDVFILDPYEITDVNFITECSIICVKTPSIPNDKIIVKKI
ncbi:MAG: hypothetical protein RLZZ328_1382 [Bacteroidota bacterium]|jgi:hypothetical protein